jgi:hypothetical protein
MQHSKAAMTTQLENALTRLIEDRDFLAIASSRRRFNIFDAIGGQRAELRHSNFLSFILSPNRLHGLGARPLQLLLRAFLEKLTPEQRPVSSLQVAVADLDDVVLHRELDYIDILIEVRDLKLVIVIENKVGAKAGLGQLQRYQTAVKARYPAWRKLHVFLTPTGADAEHPDYLSFSYSELAKIMERMLEENGTANSDTLLVLRHYIEMLRRHVVDDEELRDLAIKVYERHAGALDFILKCKPQGTNLMPVATALIEKNNSLVQDRHSSTIFRFLPAGWLKIPALNKCPAESWTKTGHNVLFELKSFKFEGEFSDRLLLSLILGPCDAKLRRYLFDQVHDRREAFKNPNKSIGQSWVTIFSRELLNEASAENMEEDEKRTTIEKHWREFEADDLPRLSSAVAKIAESAPL